MKEWQNNSTGILVIGSSNTDMVVRSNRIPLPGETILGGDFFMNAGGKGANQAVAAARLGGNVAFIGRVGNDIFGEQSITQLKREGIDSEAIITDPVHPSGVALITVDEAGENCIVVAPGANAFLSPSDIIRHRNKIAEADIILLQLEIPLETINEVIALARKNHKKVILDPAPACPLPKEIFTDLFLLTPNKVEAEMLTGVKIGSVSDCERAVQVFKAKGVRNSIITLGESGSYVNSETFSGHIPSVKVRAADTTAAGDVFTAAVAVALAEDQPVEAAVQFATKAAAIAVSRQGAQASAPYRREMGE
ncbi:ribokinase [Agriterribacter sp.]|uniref:ribokinase n=1 Tax=Agriterribacter sp. TaxID=2821509 RepID=UPI002C6FD5F9|nr:ribokinase [Agriterribacter sp.]HRP57444.1 ribokinase [Agriterribacter sp.]